MASLWWSRTTLIWLLLTVATAITWKIGHGVGFENLRYAGVAILIVTFVKTRFVIMEFMEIRNAPIAMRIGAEVWVWTVGALLVALFLSAH